MAQVCDARMDLKKDVTTQTDKDEDEDEAEAEAEELERLTGQLRDTEQDRDRLGNEVQDLKARLDELQSERELMQSALKGYETDFKAEREDKRRALSDREKLAEERDKVLALYEQLKKDHLYLKQKIQAMYLPPSTPPSRPVDEPNDGESAVVDAPRRVLHQTNQLQCPNCKKVFPYHLLEDHMRSCIEC